MITTAGIAFLVRISKVENHKCPHCIIISKDTTKIGRHWDIHLDTNVGKEISKKHALIHRCYYNGDIHFIIEDNNSVNGTFVNGKKILKQKLKSKDTVIFGGGNKYKLGDIIEKQEDSECLYRFLLPQVPVDLSHCHDLNMVLDDASCNEECCICYTTSHRMQRLSCGHSFCVSCLSKWARTCAKTLKPIVCPICRAPFHKADIEDDKSIILNGVEEIKSIEPLLRTLGIYSIETVKDLDITKPWDDDRKHTFWRYNDIVTDLGSIRRVFHTLVKVMYQQVLMMTEIELKTLLRNLDEQVNESDTRQTLRENAIATVAIKIMKVGTLVQNQSQNMFK